jgi:hypothetical protein
MQVASRPRLNAGIALVGASVVAVCPLAPSMPDVHLPSVHSAAVELAALASPVVSPIDQWTQVIQAAVANLGGLGQQLAADPAPILKQILANQSANAAILKNAGAAAGVALTTAGQALPAALQAAATSLAAGDVTDAVAALTAPVLPLVLGLIDAGFTGADAWQAVVNTVQNVANVAAVVPKLALSGLLAVASPLISDINASAAIGQAIVDAAGAGDLNGVITALVNAPATLTGATLNGFGTLPGLGTPVGGLISGPGIIPGLTDGTIAGLLSLRDTIEAALQPKVTTAAKTAAAIPEVAAKTVTLSTPAATKGAIPATTPSPANTTKTGAAQASTPASSSASASASSETDGTGATSATGTATDETQATDGASTAGATTTSTDTKSGSDAAEGTASGATSKADDTKGSGASKNGSDTKSGNANGDAPTKKAGNGEKKAGGVGAGAHHSAPGKHRR